MATTTAPFRSILFDRPADAADSTDPSVFADVNLDQVFAATAARWDEHDLMPFFRMPLHAVQSVQYRHQTLHDSEGEALSAALVDFGSRMHGVRRDLAQSAKLRCRYQTEGWFLDAARVYCQAASALSGALSAIGPGSRGLTAFRAYLAGYTASAAFTGLAAGTGAVSAALASVRYCINIKSSRVRVTRYGASPITAGRYRAPSRNSPSERPRLPRRVQRRRIRPGMVFFRAECRPDGQRTFQLLPGEPLPTSYGEDLYQ